MFILRKSLPVLLIAALLVFFGSAASAVDVKFSGQYTYEGWYESAHTLSKSNVTTGEAVRGSSVGFEAGGLILDTQFKIAEGLALYTRARVLEKIWGDIPSSTGGSTPTDVRDRTFSGEGNRYLKEDIEFTRLYVVFNALWGRFDIGYQRTTAVGTVFNNNDEDRPIAKYTYKTGPWTTYILYQKTRERDVTLDSGTPAFGGRSDNDYDQWKYFLGYAWATGDAGIGGTYYIDKSGRSASPAYQSIYHKLNPYGRATLGSLYVEGELNYTFGDYRDFEGSTADRRREGWNWYAMARYSFGPVYFGAQYALVSGDDDPNTGTYEVGPSSGREYKPCLILINPDRDKWLGALGFGGNVASGVLGDTYSFAGSGGATNFSLYQGFVGYKPIPKLDLMASFTYAALDKKGTYLDRDLGEEIDLTATYKIYDNLTYMIGFGYLWTGDAWKGTNAANQTENDWLLMHRLTLTF